jgi:hypothetical protein
MSASVDGEFRHEGPKRLVELLTFANAGGAASTVATNAHAFGVSLHARTFRFPSLRIGEAP